MNFSDILETKIQKTGITIDVFMRAVEKYNSLDLALADLPSEYIDFYSNNEKILKRPLQKRNLLESAETSGYLGFSPASETTRKKIKYKGEIIIIEWDDDNSVWIPWIAKRSIVQALRFAKDMID